MYGNYYLLKRLFYTCFDLKCYIWFAAVGAIVAVGMGVTQAVKGAQAEARARRERQQAAQKMELAAQKKLEYAAKLDTEWTQNYGEATSKAASYYSNLTGESLRQQYEMAGDQAQLQNYQNFQNQMKQLDTKINQMGMQNSSQALSALMQMSAQQMANNATINFETTLNKMKSDQEVAQQQAAWSAQGNTLKNAAIQTMNEGYNLQFQAGQALAGMAQSDIQSAQQQQASGMNNIAAGMNMLNSGWDSYQNRKTYSNAQAANRTAISEAMNNANAKANDVQQQTSNTIGGTVQSMFNPQNNSILYSGNSGNSGNLLGSGLSYGRPSYLNNIKFDFTN